MPDLDRAVRRGEEATRLLEHPLIVEAFDLLEKATLHEWRYSDPADTATRERMYQQLGALELLRDRLNEVVSTGKIAGAEIARRKRDRERLNPNATGE